MRSNLGQATILLGALLIAGVANAEQPRPSIAVTGTAFVTSAPDVAVISFAVETTAAEASSAMAENARRSQAVATALKGALGTADKLSTAGVALDPVYDHRRVREPDQPPVITGYVARNQVNVETRDTTSVGKLIDLAAKAGANRISGLQFTLQARDEAMAKALARATADARRQAAVIAEALGVKLGAVIEATTVEPMTIAPRAFRGAAMAMEADMATPVEAGDVRVDATVQVRFAID